MKIPKSFQLAGITWTVIEADDLGGDFGDCNPRTAVIRILRALPKQIKQQTFCHEFVHARKFAMGETGHDEREVDAEAALLHQFLITAR